MGKDILGPETIISDLKKISIVHSKYICHIGIFGSSLKKPLSEVNDIDVLIMYRNIDFDRLKMVIDNTQLSLNVYGAYLNGGYIKAFRPLGHPAGYHIIMMPVDRPNMDFISQHNGKIFYLTKPYELPNLTCINTQTELNRKFYSLSS